MAAEQFRLRLRLRQLSHFHTSGPGRTLPLVDRTVMVDARGLPYIPASSVRGRVRAHLERLLHGLGEPVCTPPQSELTCPHHEGVGRALEERGASEPFCPACRLFGSSWRLSPIAFNDFRLESQERGEIGLDQRTGVSINRYLGSAEEGRLYILETVPYQRGKGSAFTGSIEGFLSRRDVGWLLAALRTLTHLGGGKSRGLGRVELDSESIQLEFWNGEGQEWLEEDWRPLLQGVLEDGTN